jgi:hypothetical protein
LQTPGDIRIHGDPATPSRCEVELVVMARLQIPDLLQRGRP